MKRFFEPVVFAHRQLNWDYSIRTERHFSGYYHWHQCIEILFVHRGRGTVVVGGQTYEIRRGMLFFFQPFQLHHVHAEVSPEEPYVRSIFYVDPLQAETLLRAFPKRSALFHRLCEGNNPGQGFDLADQAEWMERIYAAYDRARKNGHGEESEEISMLLLQLLNSLMSTCAESSLTGGAVRPLRHSEKIMRWIEAHYPEEITLDRLAEETHLSKYYVSRIFRQETGSSITDYVKARRIKQACRLLETTELPVERIGILSGFESPSYFIQLFKRMIGMTPLKYRRQNRA